jgi:hypothetical protein
MLLHVAIVATAHFDLTSPASLGATIHRMPGLGTLFKFGFVTASALTHWGIYTSLLVTFALTLRSGHEPLITTMARKMHGNIEDEMVVYTGRVTIAWCCFFAVQLITSITLFCAAPLVVWSFFVNVLDVPLVIAMFSAEYMLRLRCLRNPPRHSLSVILKMITDTTGNHTGEETVCANAARPDR